MTMVSTISRVLAVFIYALAINIDLALFAWPFVAISKRIVRTAKANPAQCYVNVVRYAVIIAMFAFYIVWMYNSISLTLEMIPVEAYVASIEEMLTRISFN